MRKLLVIALTAVLPATAQQPTGPLLPVLDAAGVTRTCDEAMAAGREALAKLEAGAGGSGFLAEWNRMQIEVEDRIRPISNLGSLHPDKAVRDAAEPCIQRATAFNTDVFQSEKLYARVRAIEPASPAESKLKKDLTEGFEDSGVVLPPDKRARAKEISTRLTQISQAFVRAVREDPATLSYSDAELAGVPESFLKSRPVGPDGRRAVKVDQPSYDAVMSNATSAESRKRMYMGWVRRAGEPNLVLMEEAYRLRQELAALYGQPSFAHYVQRRRMVGSPDVVNKFLADVKANVAEVEKAEVAVLAEAKARETGKPVAETRIDRWDVAYYQNKVRRERYDVDQEKTRKYFPTPKALEFALLVSETLYGISFREAKVQAWHPEVRYFDIHDAQTGKFIANIYLDLYPRDGKRSGAWASPVRRVSTLAGRTPTSVLATNFNREGLSHREMETLLHEFGHVLHGVLSTARYAAQAGTAVKRDFVEAPSQMFEEWVRREESLALFRKVCAECPVLTREEIARLNDARRFGQGLQYAGQHLLASFDMALSTKPEKPLEAWKRLESATVLGSPEGTLRPASFMHPLTGYAAGYYGYMWSEVIGLDLLSPFEKNMLDPKVGARYRETILAQGGQVEEMEMVRRFLAREPSNKAFLDEIAGKR